MKNNLIKYSLLVWITFFLGSIFFEIVWFEYIDYRFSNHQHYIMNFYEQTFANKILIRSIKLIPLLLMLFFTLKKLSNMHLTTRENRVIILGLIVSYNFVISVLVFQSLSLSTAIIFLLSGVISVLLYKLPVKLTERVG